MSLDRVRGIIFDMDNTLLRSSIDFPAMKLGAFEFLLDQGIVGADFPIAEHTTSTLIEHAKRDRGMSLSILDELWDIVTRHELAGMQDADLEPGAVELLQQLNGQYVLTIQTNNAWTAAMTALTRNGIDGFFDAIIGRDQVKFLKPSPDGVCMILDRYSHIPAAEWLSVGDAWIDGKAAQDAGVRFVAYQGNLELMQARGVVPAASIWQLSQLPLLLLPGG